MFLKRAMIAHSTNPGPMRHYSQKTNIEKYLAKHTTNCNKDVEYAYPKEYSEVLMQELISVQCCYRQLNFEKPWVRHRNWCDLCPFSTNIHVHNMAFWFLITSLNNFECSEHFTCVKLPHFGLD